MPQRVCARVCACVGKRKGCCCRPPRWKTHSSRTLTPCARRAQMDEDVVADEDGDGGPQGGVDVLMGDGDGGAPGGAPNGACSSPCAAKQGYHFSFSKASLTRTYVGLRASLVQAHLGNG